MPSNNTAREVRPNAVLVDCVVALVAGDAMLKVTAQLEGAALCCTALGARNGRRSQLRLRREPSGKQSTQHAGQCLLSCFADLIGGLQTTMRSIAGMHPRPASKKTWSVFEKLRIADSYLLLGDK